MSDPSQPETLADIFRQEALEHRARSSMRLGEPLGSSAGHLQGAIWILVGTLAVSLALAGNLTVDETVTGPAIVRAASTTEGAPGEGGGVSVSCRVVGYVPAQHRDSIHPGTKARLTLLGSGTAVEFDVELDRADPSRISTDTVRELLGDPVLSGGQRMIEVAGHIDPGAARAGARGARERNVRHEAPSPLECPSGARGTIEVPLPPRSLLSAALALESAAPSEGPR